MKTNMYRRSFFGKTVAAGGAILTGGGEVNAKPRRKTPTVELLQIGVVAVRDYSHLPTIWGPTINQVDSDTWPVGRTTRMLITHCWDRNYDVAQDFAKKYKCTAMKNYYDMVDKVDGMIFGGFYEVKWWPQLTKPYLEAGIPCHINRPFALSIKSANEMVERAKKNNTAILCTDEREYLQQSIVGRSKVEELLKEGKTIAGANGDNSAGNEYPAHGVHGLYFMLAILGLDVERVSLQANGWWNEKTPTSPNPQTWAQLNLQYKGIKFDGVPEQKTPFIASQLQSGAGGDAGMRIYYSGPSRGFWDIHHPWTYGEQMNRIYYLFFPTVLAMQRMFETKKMQWSYDYILKKTKIFLTGFKSHLDHNGAMLSVADLPEDWEAPSPYSDWIDEEIFK